MLKVLHSVNKMDRAGQETFIMNLFRKIDRSKIQFDFLCADSEKGDFDDEIYALGGCIFYLPIVTMKGPLKQAQKFYSLMRALRAHRCDVFHIHTHHAMDAFRDALAAKLCGIKIVVVHSHNTSVLFHQGAHRLFRKLLPLLPILRFACSRAAGEWMFVRQNFRVLHNGLDVDDVYFQAKIRDTVRQEMGWEDKKIVGHVGRFNEQKNHRFLVEIFAEMHRRDPQIHLVLVGKGDLEEEIRRKVAEKGLTEAVSFMGVRDDMRRLYQGMDMLLFPSLFEGLSVVLVEAQSCDLPCLISDTNSSEVLLTDRVVMKSLADPAEQWAFEALAIVKDASPRRDNRDVMRRVGYDIAALADALEEVYRAVV